MGEQAQTGYPSIDKPWLKYYSAEAINAKLPECTMYEHIKECNQDNLRQIAINYYGNKITYGQMFENIEHLAASLEEMGVKEGDVVTIAMINSPETIGLLFALNKLGAIANMVYGQSSPEELCRDIIAANSSLVFTLDLFQEKFARITADAKLKKIVVASLTQSMSLANKLGARLLKGMKPLALPDSPLFLSWKQFISTGKRSPETYGSADSPAVITYTGGTTGGSKGAILSNRAVLAVAEQYLLTHDNIKRDSTWAQVLPLFIAYGVTCSLMIPLIAGMTSIVRIPMSESIADICKKFHPNHIMYGPVYWEALADENQPLDLSNFIDPVTGGDTLRGTTEHKINRYLEKCGSPYPLMNGYGMTEVGAAVSVNMKTAHEVGSVGIPFVKNVIAAFDVETGKELPYNQQGEICIQTVSTMLGYVNNPIETANIIKLHDDGSTWVHSGDLGYVTADGFVHISGRLKRYMLRVADGLHKKVFSLDIEKVLIEHPLVENCAVVPVSDPVTVQSPVAFIVVSKGIEAGSNLEGQIRAYAEEELPQSHWPVQYIFLNKFPLTKAGKINYLELEANAEKMQKTLSQ